MKASRVDKTKRAIEEFYASDTLATTKCPKIDASGRLSEAPSSNAKPEGNPKEKITTLILPWEGVSMTKTSSQIPTPKAADKDDLEVQLTSLVAAKSAIPSGISMGLESDRRLLISSEYTPEDLSYFSLVNTALHSFEATIIEYLIFDPQCKKELEDLSRQVLAIKETGTNSLGYVPLMEGKMVDVDSENVWILLKAFNPEVSSLRLSQVSKVLGQRRKVFDLFTFYAFSDMTIRELCMAFQLYWEKLFPVHVLDCKSPNVITSNLFASPWAPNIKLEEFFYQTSETFKELLSDHVRINLATLLLVVSSTVDAGRHILLLAIFGEKFN